MKQVVIIVFCLFGCYIVHAQKRRREATAEETKIWDSSWNCSRAGSLSTAERLKKYPFSKAKEIQLVSFKSSDDPGLGDGYKDSLPRMNDTICYSKLFEVLSLAPPQVDSLTDLIYNYGRAFVYRPKRKVYFIDVFSQCYNPRNAILFLDEKKNVFEFIEICFECEHSRTSSGKIGLGDECHQRYSLIQNFFRQAGIEYVESEWRSELEKENTTVQENEEEQE